MGRLAWRRSDRCITGSCSSHAGHVPYPWPAKPRQNWNSRAWMGVLLMTSALSRRAAAGLAPFGKCLSCTSDISECPADSELRDSFEMAHIAGDKLEAVIECGRRNLEIGIGESRARFLHQGSNPAEYLRDGGVERKYDHSRQHALLDILEMTLLRLGSVGALVEFANGDGTDKLIFARQRANSSEVRRRWRAPQQLGDCVGIEEVWQEAQSSFVGRLRPRRGIPKSSP
jgi:hypothetical protein